MADLAITRGLAIVAEYSDAVESGKDDDRPGFQAMLRDIRAPGRTWDHILVLDTARIARRRTLAIIFEEQECARRGIKIIYKSLPESDPITEMLLKSILQAMDEWHSLTSKAKGLSGMAENIKQGWRAGGRAPRGYRLHYEETGAIRDGQAVRKSRLVTGDDALIVKAYLTQRARGLKRAMAVELSGLTGSTTSLLEIERNALVYAGHTTWNRTAERTKGGYMGGQKYRPKEEWVIQRNTHEPIISDEEAEAILAKVSQRQRRSGGHPSKRAYLLSGLLYAPDGAAWYGDAGYYRIKKDVRINAVKVEDAVLERVAAELQTDEMATAIAAHYRRLAKTADSQQDEAGQIKRKLSALEKKNTRLIDLLSQTSAPEALLRQIEAGEEERVAMLARLESAEAEKEHARVLRDITAADVKRLLGGVLLSLKGEKTGVTADMLNRIIERVTLDAETLSAEITFRVEAAKSGVLLASPRGFEPRLSP